MKTLVLLLKICWYNYFHDAKILKELVDPDEFKELAWEAFNDEGYDLVNKIY